MEIIIIFFCKYLEQNIIWSLIVKIWQYALNLEAWLAGAVEYTDCIFAEW